jgi:hypothetical protein
MTGTHGIHPWIGGACGTLPRGIGDSMSEDRMKIEMVVFDAGALEIVFRCVKCQARVTMKPADWKDDLDACSGCGAPWAQQGDAAIANRALSSLRDLVRAADARQLPFEVLFAASRIIRNAA